MKAADDEQRKMAISSLLTGGLANGVETSNGHSNGNGHGNGQVTNKQDYLDHLQSRLDYIVQQDNEQARQQVVTSLNKSQALYEHLSAETRRYVEWELHERASARIARAEEAELKEKRRILKRMERQRKRADAEAKARAEALERGEPFPLEVKEEDDTPKKASLRKKKEDGGGGDGGGEENDEDGLADTTTAAATAPSATPGSSRRSSSKRKTSASASGGLAAASEEPVSITPSKRIKTNEGSAATPATATATVSVKSARRKAAEERRKEREKDKEVKEREQRDAKAAKEAAREAAKESTKGPTQKEVKAMARQYATVYEGIWKDLTRREASKGLKQFQAMYNVRQSNGKKTAVLVSKEARRWQYRTNKNIKDLQSKARRGMKEMLSFWKRNEREEREQRRRAERVAIDNAKKEDEERESRRQARKLNFLITQTELYSHFIGRKIKTDEAEGEDGDARFKGGLGGVSSAHGDVTEDLVQAHRAAQASDLDFDGAADDDLRMAAMANAHNAVMQAKTAAQQFNGQDPNSAVKQVDIDSDEMNFQNPTSLGDIQIPQPKMLKCQLKEYQLKGLNWLANLYEQGINGILADEMGLGKTVQSMSVMAYLAETHNIWGPFLVIAPASTLHNWQQEVTRFIPEFKTLPYWGSGKDRKVLRKFWDRKNLTYTRDSPFHVLITSYQIVVADAQYFQRVKWQYMILDEAQAIKSSQSTRWKSLLSFQCRNRLLLTGTPIQNSMQELWALLHFIMPSLFDSHEEFSEWFSKDIESHATSNTKLNEQQLKRLHMILKPFMLRRIKKNVQQELGDKIEIDVYCDLTNRQRVLYRMLRSQISLMDLIERAVSGTDEGQQSLMNLVMQFRKVCNHPDLFERADVKSALSFCSFGQTPALNRAPAVGDVSYSARNLIEYAVPKLVYQESVYVDRTDATRASKQLSVWTPDHIQADMMADGATGFGWALSSGLSAGQISARAHVGPLESVLQKFIVPDGVLQDDDDTIVASPLLVVPPPKLKLSSSASPTMTELLSVGAKVAVDSYYNVFEKGYDDRVLSPPISLTGSDRRLVVQQEEVLFDSRVRSALSPMTLSAELALLDQGCRPGDFPLSNLYPPVDNERAGYTTIRMPSMARFVSESGKLSRLDSLLTELKAGDHRVLIYFQMTKMMDLMEEFLTFRQHKYVRLDGSSRLSDRRDLVHDWQTRPELFVFLLSTRAGGLGINLTAADTVIFYDSDWNPTIDSQAMDRAHRLGQTRQVTVYRLLVKGTIEERMRDRAKQKMHVQQVVMEGGTGDDSNAGVEFNKPGREVAFWLLDDDAAVDEAIKNKEKEREEKRGKPGPKKKQGAGSGAKAKAKSLEDMYHEDEGNFDESNRPSETVTPLSTSGTNTPRQK